MATPINRIWHKPRLRPTTRPMMSRKPRRRVSSIRRNCDEGVNSSAMPVKCRETSDSGMRRRPMAGSWITTPLRSMATSTTKWLMFQ